MTLAKAIIKCDPSSNITTESDTATIHEVSSRPVGLPYGSRFGNFSQGSSLKRKGNDPIGSLT
jgi:hypothetical protein